LKMAAAAARQAEEHEGERLDEFLREKYGGSA
jgi:hypothetical protein